ncbi:Lipopolysaccharide export system protein LptA [Aliiroseovarius pelagivivens]|uniref:Lipopolysaccharide export system protein LptA n=1 Tax=Aliiroseovarius pelagivivens TaxID=1639690 RepID=A0A2R8ASK3_9RHOB|nr:LptA/OstA family protein [Aliiroseovarius pelagivivens]SPF78995.1 Lipopolysaccharide export system protein LptA [Aliiroseovarius pelagivivens]
MIKRSSFYALLVALCLPVAAFAQSNVAFGGLKHDSSLPIEISADQLTVDQASGAATFQGNVTIGQGDMRLSAGKVRVEYATGTDTTGEISRLHATNGVTLVNGAEAAEAREAVYTIATGMVVMTGGVILTQGQNALSSDKLTVNLRTGTGQMDGRVKSIIQTGEN